MFEKFEKILYKIATALDIGGRVLAAILLLLLLANIVGAQLGMPVYGVVEYAAFLTAGVIAFGLTKCGLDGGHIAVTVLVDKFPLILRKITCCLMSLICVAMTATISWRCFILAGTMHIRGETTASVYMPVFPVIYILSISFFGMSLSYVVELIKNLHMGEHGIIKERDK